MLSAAAIVAAGVGLVPGVANATGPDGAKGTGGAGVAAPDLDLTKAETYGAKTFKSPAGNTVHPAAKGRLAAPQAEGAQTAAAPTVEISGGYTSAHGVALDLAVTSDPGTALGVLVEWGDGSQVQLGANGPTDLSESHVYAEPGVYQIKVSLLSGSTVVGSNAVVAYTPGSSFTPHAPTRLLDTREGIGANQGKVAAFGTARVKIAGGQIPEGVTAVALNVTVTNTAKPGHIRAYGEGEDVPSTSNVNYEAGQSVPNLVIVPVGENGYVDLYNHGDAAVDLIADVTGFFNRTAANGYTSLDPARLVDTREGLGTGSGKVAAFGSFSTQVTGRVGVPADAKAVALNVTVTEPDTDGHLTVFPAGGQAPTTSNLNFTKGQTIANAVIVPIGADGRISVRNGSGGTGSHVVVDVVGYYSAAGESSYVPRFPERWFDTRGSAKGALEGRSYIYSEFFGDDKNITGVVLNTTVTNTVGTGYLTVAPDPNTWLDYENEWDVPVNPPFTSALNWTPGKTVPNLVQASTGNTRVVDFWNMGYQPTDLVVDLFGFYAKN